MPDAAGRGSQALEFQPLPAADLRAYVALARRLSPHFPPQLTDYVADMYAELRQEEADVGDQAHSYTTARTLLSILRLASALARLRFAPEVAQSDVDEALRLMKMSKASLADEAGKSKRALGGDPISEIFALLRNLAEQRNVTEISYTDAVVRCPRLQACAAHAAVAGLTRAPLRRSWWLAARMARTCWTRAWRSTSRSTCGTWTKRRTSRSGSEACLLPACVRAAAAAARVACAR